MDFNLERKDVKLIAQTEQPKYLDRPLSSTSITLGDIAFGASLIAVFVGLIGGIINLSLKASRLKNDLDMMDIKLSQALDTKAAVTSQKLENIDSDVKQKYDALNARLDTGFEHIRAEMMQLRVRVGYNSTRIRQVEFYLGKTGYVPRQDNEDSLS